MSVRQARADEAPGSRLIAEVEALRRAQPQDAWALLARDFPGATRGASADRRGELWRLRGHVLRALSRLPAAARAYRRAEEWFGRAGEGRERGRCAIGLVDTLMYLGRYQEAEAVASRGRRDLLRAGDRVSQARLLNNEGNLYHRLDRPDRALERYREARRFLARAGDRRGLGLVDGNIANCLSLLGRTTEARRLYRGAHRASASRGFAVEALNAEYNLAYLDFLEHRHERSLDGLERAREQARNDGVPSIVALTSLDRSEILLRLGDHDGALEEARTAITAFRGLGMNYERAKAEVFAALAQFRLGRRVAARASLERALADFEAEGNAVWAGEALVGLATAWWSHGSPASAVPLLASAARRFAWAGDAEREGCALALLTSARLETGGRGAAATLERAKRVAGRRPSARLTYLLLVAAAELARRRGDAATARRHLIRAARASERLAAGILDEQWRASFWGEWGLPHLELATLEMEAGRPEAAFEALERGRGRVLASAWRRGPARQALRGWAAGRLARERERGTRSGSIGVAVERPTPAAVRTALASPIAPSFGLRQVRAGLPEGAAVLDFAIHRGALSAFLVGRDRLEGLPHLVGEGELSRLSNDLLFELRRAALEPRSQRVVTPALTASLEQMASLVLWPALESGGRVPHELALVPSGPLGRLPWAALPLPDGRPLCTATHLTLVPGLRLAWSFRRPKPANSPPLVVAVETDGLEKVKVEAEAVAEALPGAILLAGIEATADRFLSMAPRSSWIHFAGHGVYQAGRSGVRLSDRWLLAEELGDLRLSARGVALSACQTARALVRPGEEWFGFPRNLLLSGAGAVLAAQWDVDDSAAATFMSVLYGGLAAGAALGEAVARTQARLAAGGAHPLDWAGFVVLGGPRANSAAPITSK